jgi:hypothetical protein
MFRGAFFSCYQIRKDRISNPLRQLRYSQLWLREISIYPFLEARVPGENDSHQSVVKRIKER